MGMSMLVRGVWLRYTRIRLRCGDGGMVGGPENV
jgi:hypothetical protein